ncbi:MAG: cyclic pyranopterin monophosphate synthase MoaC [Planctomycetes bacterium]|nr:cyclic pyranopterin monophosphate synthase MoaC [Planctomycetota bacterium]
MGPRKLTHLDERGAARMVDVGAKQPTAREAVARAVVTLPAVCRRALRSGTSKGDVLQIARLAGIQAAKRTDELIPLCHQVPLDGVSVDFLPRRDGVEIRATARCTGRTGVEMEALVAASIAALTVYDMLKALSHDIVIGAIELVEKRGGKRGTILRTVARSAR